MNGLYEVLRDDVNFNKLLDAARGGVTPFLATGVSTKVAPILIGATSEGAKQRLIIASDEIKGRQLAADLKNYTENVYYYPAKDVLFYYADVAGNETAKARLEIIKHLTESENITVVTTIEGLMDKLPPKYHFAKNAMEIKVDSEIDWKSFNLTLTSMGFELVDMVEEPGQFSVRGGIIDVYPLTEECPYRIELFDTIVDEIRSFDIDTQRSIEKISEFTIYPSTEFVLNERQINEGIRRIKDECKARIAELKAVHHSEQCNRLTKKVDELLDAIENFPTEVNYDNLVNFFYDETESFLDYFDADASIYAVGVGNIKGAAEVYEIGLIASLSSRLEGGYILPSEATISYGSNEIIGRLMNRNIVLFSSENFKDKDLGIKASCDIRTSAVVSYENKFTELVEDIKKYAGKDYRVVILSPSKTRATRLAKEITDAEVPAYFKEKITSKLAAKEVVVSVGRISEGFILDDSKLFVIGEEDIFTKKEIKKKRRKKFTEGEKIESFVDITVGDYVVHENHGVGVYRGLEKVEAGGIIKDYISIEYLGGSKLFVPVEQLGVIGKLTDKSADRKPKLNKLGGADWTKVRTRVRERVDNIARELVELYAIRQSSKGFAYSADSSWQEEFEEMFPYDETYDQQKAIDDTKKDMESDKIMDRLVCGDVGFGKTEVALRAAFKAVQDGKQVAYLVPTTILCEQHFETFKERMKNYPVEIRMLSRFCSTKQIRETLKDLKNGAVDIVIGTHRLISKDVEFKDLGLLIIDEEQRFGVKHKETIKQMKKNVDVLTLTATPIPRTMHMSLVGIRDISLLLEPPVDRNPIQTFVMEHDMEFVKEAVNRELARDGQVFYVHNRVNNIDEVASSLREILPEVRIEFAHGKMDGKTIEDIMRRFVKKEIDVLVSTTIIETGLDIPNVNTIIIDDADKFGLSQLYQLRGRVGRSNRSAYAFLMYKRDKVLREVAEKRLEAIKEFSGLGSGYKISLKDLEIRGAGNLVGSEQSGNIEAVGYDLYCKMLADAVNRLKGNEIKVDFTTSIDLPVDAYIADNYVKNEFAKLDFYKRIARVTSEEDVEEIVAEAKDRFGEPPREFYELLDISKLRHKANGAYITEIKDLGGRIRFAMHKDAPVLVERVDTVIKRYGGKLRILAGDVTSFVLSYELEAKDKLGIQDEMILLADEVINDIMYLYGDKTEGEQNE